MQNKNYFTHFVHFDNLRHILKLIAINEQFQQYYIGLLNKNYFRINNKKNLFSFILYCFFKYTYLMQLMYCNVITHKLLVISYPIK